MIYRVKAQCQYLQTIADFLYANYLVELDKVTIILPSGVACYYLKELLKSNINKSTFLPEITPIINLRYLYVEKENIASYEQKYALASIIKSYNSLHIDFVTALKLVDNLYNLISKFAYNDVDMADLDNIIDLENEPEHWYITQNLLKFTSSQWRSYLNNNNKIDFAQNYLRIVKTLPEIITKNSNRVFILAGFFGDNKILQTMIKECSLIKNCHVILPPFDLKNKVEINSDLASTNPFFFIRNFLENSNILATDILELNKDCKVNSESKIQYFSAYNIREEVKLIVTTIQEIIYKEAAAKILLVTENTKLINLLSNSLTNLGIVINNHIAYNFLDDVVALLFIEMANIFSHELDLQSLINVLKNPFFLKHNIARLESEIIKNNEGHVHVSEILAKYQQYYPCLEYLNEVFSKKSQCKKIKDIALLHIELFKYFYEEHEYLSDLFELLLNVVSLLDDSKALIEYKEILKIFLNSKNNLEKISQDAKVIIVKANDSIMIDSKYVIIPEFNDDIWPKDLEEDTWLTPTVRNKLAFSGDKHRISLSFYIFACLQSRKNVYLTRSLYCNKKPTNASRFSRVLSQNMSDSKKDSTNISNQNPAIESNDFVGAYLESARYFPNKMSASSIELLVRNPYGLYAGKILKLSKFKYLHDFDSNTEFGSFLHKVIELYTKNFMHYSNVNLRDEFLAISDRILSKNYAPFKSWWQRRLNNFADSFIAFDLNRRSNIVKIFSEHSGEIVLDLVDRSQKITAIADRIEICRENKVHILDYKTGTLPSNKDVGQGLSPQLIVNALVAYYGGFKEVPSSSMIELYYVKLSTKEPFVQTYPVKINLEELLSHKGALSSLLKFYSSDNAVFIAHPNKAHSPKYDDYKHLARVV